MTEIINYIETFKHMEQIKENCNIYENILKIAN